MEQLALFVVLCTGAILALTWVGYPIWLRLLATGNPRRLPTGPRASWPYVTIVVVVRNIEATARDLLDHLVAQAYPRDQRRILIVSDASDDFTDTVVRTYAHHGVELIRIMKPHGRTLAENIARRHVHSSVMVVVDPAARPRPGALAALVRPFADPTIGVAYAREVPKEPSYAVEPFRASPAFRYEEWVREMETRVFGTVSARGSMYAVRWPIFLVPLRPWLSSDFALTLAASDQGCRAVYVKDAQCGVVREPAFRVAFGHTVRGVTRDALTLFSRPRFLDPRRVGPIAWELLFHKVGRWLSPWAALAGFAGLLVLSPTVPWARWTVFALAAIELQGMVAAMIPSRSRLLWLLATPGRVTMNSLATVWGSFRALRLALRLRPFAALPARN